jgi:peptidoglycan-associated lipoprotein
MFRYSNSLRAASAVVAVVALAACAQPAQQAAAPWHDAATSGPELAGVWYQVYFDTGSATVNPRGQTIASAVAKVVNENPDTRLTVTGRTDRVGAPPANLALSQRRAQAVRDALVAAGVPSARISTSWAGEERTATSRPDDGAEPHNRVVDITVVKPAS